MAEFFIGLDLGQKRDYTAVAIVERDSISLNLRHLERLKLNTSYTVVVDRVQELMRMTVAYGPVTLIVDATGVGLAVFDELRSRGLKPVGVTITSGRSVSEADGLVRVPKRDLVVTLVTLVETGRLKIATGLPNSADLIDELLGFKRRINQRTRRETYQAGTGAAHDDIVVAVALACFRARTR
jgi:hypothetical protein